MDFKKIKLDCSKDQNEELIRTKSDINTFNNRIQDYIKSTKNQSNIYYSIIFAMLHHVDKKHIETKNEFDGMLFFYEGIDLLNLRCTCGASIASLDTYSSPQCNFPYGSDFQDFLAKFNYAYRLIVHYMRSKNDDFDLSKYENKMYNAIESISLK